MKFLPFLIPFFPNKKFFFQILNYLKKKKISKIEIGIPYYYSYLDSYVIKKEYKKFHNKVKILKVLKKIKKKYKNFFRIIIVCYYDSVLEIGEKKIFYYIKNKFIHKLIIIDLPYNIKKYIYKKIIKYLIFLVPYKKIKIYCNKKECFYYHLEKKEKILKKIKNKNKYSIVGFHIKKKKYFKKFLNSHNNIAIGSFFINDIKNMFIKKIKYKINKFIKC
ncbi:tryptophan synthase subunit alpha [Candidatus Vidania fulgoroideorum]